MKELTNKRIKKELRGILIAIAIIERDCKASELYGKYETSFISLLTYFITGESRGDVFYNNFRQLSKDLRKYKQKGYIKNNKGLISLTSKGWKIVGPFTKREFYEVIPKDKVYNFKSCKFDKNKYMSAKKKKYKEKIEDDYLTKCKVMSDGYKPTCEAARYQQDLIKLFQYLYTCSEFEHLTRQKFSEKYNILKAQYHLK